MRKRQNHCILFNHVRRTSGGTGARLSTSLKTYAQNISKACAALALGGALLLAGTGCVKKTQVKADKLMLPSFSMTRDEAVQRLEQVSRDSQAIQNINAKVSVQATIGGVRTATMSESPELDGNLLLQRPDRIRLRARLLGATAFDLISDGETYRILIPQKNQMWEGMENGPPVGEISKDQMINTFVTLRPKQVRDAALINVLPLLEDKNTYTPVEVVAVRGDRKLYYVVYFTRGAARESRLIEKVWFDLSTAKQPIARRQTFKDNGEIDTDVRYAGWEQARESGISIPSSIQIEFPDREIVLTIRVDPASVIVNGKLNEGAFELDPGKAEIKALPAKGSASLPE